MINLTPELIFSTLIALFIGLALGMMLKKFTFGPLAIVSVLITGYTLYLMSLEEIPKDSGLILPAVFGIVGTLILAIMAIAIGLEEYEREQPKDKE